VAVDAHRGIEREAPPWSQPPMSRALTGSRCSVRANERSARARTYLLCTVRVAFNSDRSESAYQQ
jgi:hypothetical protein